MGYMFDAWKFNCNQQSCQDVSSFAMFVFVQLIFGPGWPMNQMNKNSNIAQLEASYQLWQPTSGLLLVLMGECGQLHGVEGVAADSDVLVHVVHTSSLAEKRKTFESEKT